MKVIWSDRALKSLAAIYARISADSDDIAIRTIDLILKRGDQLATFPRSGRRVSHANRPGVREIIEAPYRIVYRIKRAGVEIIDVFHSARRLR